MNRQKNDDHRIKSLVRRHAVFGWWSLMVFLSLGILLEALHALKIGWYLEPSYGTRRLMWTLSHAHGTLLSLVHGLFAVTVVSLRLPSNYLYRLASPCLMAASVLLPGGFFLGGIFVHGGDPGMGVFLVPAGAAVLLCAIFLTALSITRHPFSVHPEPVVEKSLGNTRRGT